MTRRQRHRLFQWAGWLAIWAIWIQALLPVANLPERASLGQLAAGDIHSLCYTPSDAPASPADKAPAHKLPPCCAVCQTFQMLAGAFPPPNLITLKPPGEHSLVIARLSDNSGPTSWLHLGARARAPPV